MMLSSAQEQSGRMVEEAQRERGMTDIFAPVRERIAISVPEAHKRKIAIVGAGEIVDLAHLPAYSANGVAVEAIFDLDEERAADVAARHGISQVCSSLDDILEDETIEVVDIGIFPWAQKEVAIKLLDAGKHLLCQKPLSYNYDEATAIVEHAAKCGRKLAVNQQFRFSETIAAAKAMIDLGWIGDPFDMSFDFHVYTPWEVWAWIGDLHELDLQQFSIHPLDSMRYLLGAPLRVFGTQAQEPGQPQKGDTRTISILEYDDDRRGFLRSFHKNRTGDPRAEMRIDGTEGSIRATIGLMYNYPEGRADTLELNSRVLPTDGWLHYPVTNRWIPNAFIGPMASLLEAIAEDGTPATDGADNLTTLRMIHGLYASGRDHCAKEI